MATSDEGRKAGSKAGRIALGADFGGDRGDVYGSIIVCCVVGALLLVLLYPYREHAANMLLTGIVAALLGWGAGLVATPYSSGEASRLSDISKVGYAALTGYLVAHFNKLFDALFSTKDNAVTVFPYVGFGLAWFLLALLITYYTRSYRISPPIKPEKQDYDAIEKEHGSLPDNATPEQKAERYQLVQAAALIRVAKQKRKAQS
jgi:hypothetical protein